MENAGMIAMIAVGVIFVAVALICVPRVVSEIFDNVMRDSTILKTIKRLYDLKFEVEVVLDKDGEIFSETTQYYADFVRQSDEQVARFKEHGDLTQIHNHVDDTPPSVQDLLYAAEADFAQMIVVTPTWAYYLSRPDGGWGEEADINRALNKHIHLFDKRRVGNSGLVAIEPDGAVVVLEDYEIVSTDKALAAVCCDLGYTFIKEEVDN